MSGVTQREYTLEQGLQSVGQGWAPLVTRAFGGLPAGARIVQVKEKFAALRIYAEAITDKYQSLLEELEVQSQTICEVCGNPGETRSETYWMYTACPDHIIK